MALLTAEDVLNKAFTKTKYREGFDQDEVDDFLDEVANTIAALTAERDELQQRVAQAQAGGGMPAPAPAAPAVPASGGAQSLIEAATDPNPPSATSMLSMAQKLHDEYVQAGEEERERIIDEAKAKAETIIQGAEADARARVRDLESERAGVERAIDDLRRFERDYRSHLKNYLENLLGDLEHSASKGNQAPASAAPEATPSESAPRTDEFATAAPQEPTESYRSAAEPAPEPQDAPSYPRAEAPADAPAQEAPAAPAAQETPAYAPPQAAAPYSAPQDAPAFPEPSEPFPSAPAAQPQAPVDGPVEFPKEWSEPAPAQPEASSAPDTDETPRWNF